MRVLTGCIHPLAGDFGETMPLISVGFGERRGQVPDNQLVVVNLGVESGEGGIIGACVAFAVVKLGAALPLAPESEVHGFMAEARLNGGGSQALDTLAVGSCKHKKPLSTVRVVNGEWSRLQLC